MIDLVPHPIPYQGSKRRLAASILHFAPPDVIRVIEPFAGSAAITLAAAQRGVGVQFVIGDVLDPLVRLWQLIIAAPQDVADRYSRIWHGDGEDLPNRFANARALFNETGDPCLLLYLLARCVKNAVRFNPKGQFNQSADHRRKGMHPDRMRLNLNGAARLLRGRCEVLCADYEKITEAATVTDLIYMDPPYQGVSSSRDPRYFKQLTPERLSATLEKLNSRGVQYLLSYDGHCGDRIYGAELPPELALTRVMIRVGKSAQATLAGRDAETVESLYISPALAKKKGVKPAVVSVRRSADQLSLFSST